MATTYTLIKGETLASSAASYTFSAIPSTYTDLVIRMSLRSTSTTNGARLRVNGASSAYSALTLNGDGAVAISQIIAAGTYVNLGELNPSTTTANTFTSLEVYLPNYLSSASKPLSNIASTENNSTTAYTVSVAGLCTTAAYNSIEIYVSTNAFVAGSSFYLYGIKSS